MCHRITVTLMETKNMKIVKEVLKGVLDLTSKWIHEYQR